jgi:hypothetical protein
MSCMGPVAEHRENFAREGAGLGPLPGHRDLAGLLPLLIVDTHRASSPGTKGVASSLAMIASTRRRPSGQGEGSERSGRAPGSLVPAPIPALSHSGKSVARLWEHGAAPPFPEIGERGLGGAGAWRADHHRGAERVPEPASPYGERHAEGAIGALGRSHQARTRA